MTEGVALRVVVGDTTFELAPPGPHGIGRHPDSAIAVDDDRVSRHHAELSCDGAGWQFRDLGSSNGSFVDGARIDTIHIAAPVRIRLGDAADGYELELTPEGGPAVSAAEPEPERAGTVTASHGAVVPVPGGGALRLGRARDNDIVVDDLQASRHHAEVRAVASGYEVVDLGSANGTFVDGQRVDRVALREGNVVGIGRYRYVLRSGALHEEIDTGRITFEAIGLTVEGDEGRVLLDAVSFALEHNEFLAVVGPSGAGKSTLLNALTGFRPAPRGVVLYDGLDLYENYEQLRLRIGLVPQDDVLHRDLTVYKALEYASALRFPPDVPLDVRRRRIDEVLVELGLDARRDLLISRLSGGQRKRLSVGLELLTRPSLLFLDEPTSGLDPGYERDLMQSLRDLADGGATVVVVTHSTDSLDLCDRVLFLAPGGRTAYFGPAWAAREFFGLPDFQTIFHELTTDTTRDWTTEFRSHPDYARYMPAAATDGAGVVRAGRDSTQPTVTPPRVQGRGHQFVTLTRRYTRVFLANRGNLVLVALQAPLIGFLMLWALPAHQLGPPPSGTLRVFPKTSLVLYLLVLAATQLGAASAVREIVKELPILRRERAAGLSLTAYLGSKVAVLSVITVVQTTVLVLIATARQGQPQGAVALGWPMGELIIDVALVGIAAMALGLLVSSFCSTADQALTLLPIMISAQLILSGGGVLPELLHKPVLREMSYVTSAQWGFAATASTADLNTLQQYSDRLQRLTDVNPSKPDALVQKLSEPARGNPRWRHDSGIWLADILALLLITIACVVLAAIMLVRRDPGPAP